MHQSYASSDLGKVPCCNGDQLDTGVELIAMESIVADLARFDRPQPGKPAAERAELRGQNAAAAEASRREGSRSQPLTGR